MKTISSWRELTLREKIGQTVIVLSHTEKHIAKCGGIEKYLERYPIGGLHCSAATVKGFRGVTVTDALIMGGFSGADAIENTIRSFMAGNDMLL